MTGEDRLAAFQEAVLDDIGAVAVPGPDAEFDGWVATWEPELVRLAGHLIETWRSPATPSGAATMAAWTRGGSRSGGSSAPPSG